MTQGIGSNSYLDMNGDEVLIPEDFERRKRGDTTGLAGIPAARQDDLRTIMLGHLMHLAGVGGLPWRAALPSEIAECGQIMMATFAAYNAMLAAQADYALRCQAQAVEAAQARLQQPVNPDDPADADARSQAQTAITNATADVMAVVAFRNRYPTTPADPAT